MSGQRGFTLTEILVASAVVGLVMAGAFGIFSIGLKSYAIGSDRTEVNQYVRLSIEAITSDLRVACLGGPTNLCLSNISATGFTVHRFDPRCDSDETQIVYAFASGQLTRQVTLAPAPCATDAAPQIIADGMDVFEVTYRDHNGAATLIPATVRDVQVRLAATVRAKNEVGQAQMRSVVRLRNVL